ncbi:hypothetical protein P4U05_05110 [Bacillus paranthracis]|uniref:Uncharacterized protein n=1 Tax=Bacillus paranthracis TaxID=2026186 RepID=A0AAJ1NJQ8_9BACI|nr:MULTISPECIES: hypothetical protein [Bacillus]ADY22272.1 hypothetical protein YBT020_15210 [Bacillus thuringiensis serovar finitimus YBT-020]MCW4578141.1 hypothetical protein [Bacillus pacificus]MDA1584911.1 hypothetical protein [Bacillus cereus group sp. TH230-1LC]MRC71080.1 hypothetical protein [Bacillus thuringiensis]OTX69762.1 hypothetical protein BK722_15285 [Bacillus thuringiensis serovar finitimus]
MFKWFQKENNKGNEGEDGQYLEIKNEQINEQLKQKIMELENLSEDICSKYQKIYEERFVQKGKLNLKLSIIRDIDGDELEELTSNNCLEYEYRSEINFECDALKTEEVCTILLWYYYKGYRKSSNIGTLYSGTINELEEEVKTILEELLHSKDNY